MKLPTMDISRRISNPMKKHLLNHSPVNKYVGSLLDDGFTTHFSEILAYCQRFADFIMSGCSQQWLVGQGIQSDDNGTHPIRAKGASLKIFPYQPM